MKASPQPFLRTGRLRLDPLRAADAEDLVGVLADEGLDAFTGGTPPDLGTLRRRFTEQARQVSPDGRELWLNWTVRLRDSGEAVGYVQATVDDQLNAEIAYLIAARWQNRGIATEAVGGMVASLRERPGVRTVSACIASGHRASEGVAKAVGLRPTDERTAEGERVWRDRVDLGARKDEAASRTRLPGAARIPLR